MRVARQNLVADPPPFGPGACDIVFCRNVLIYIRHEDVVGFIARVDDWLGPDGWLFLGYSETLWQLTDRLRVQPLGEAFVYRRRQPAPTPPPAGGPTMATAIAPGSRRADKRPGDVPRSGRVARVTRPISTQNGGSGGGGRRLPRSVRPRADATPELLAAGEAATAAGDHLAAVRAFRKYAFLDPDQPVAHLRLALALEEIGDSGAARRAYAAAREALGRSETAAVEANLEGYRIDELVRLIDAKLTPRSRPSSR